MRCANLAAHRTAIDDLPRLTDDDREAAESGYVALEGVPVGGPRPRFRIYRQSLSHLLAQLTRCLSRADVTEALQILRHAQRLARRRKNVRRCPELTLERALEVVSDLQRWNERSRECCDVIVALDAIALVLRSLPDSARVLQHQYAAHSGRPGL